MAWSVAEIDAMLAAPKRMFGAPEWNEDGPRASLSAAIAYDAGKVIGGLSLRLSALIHLPAPARGSAVLILDGASVQRLSFRPDHPHINPARDPVAAALRRVKLPAGPSRLYRWSDDRLWPRFDRAGVGVGITPEPATLEDAFALFLDRCAIAGTAPPPPQRAMLEF